MKTKITSSSGKIVNIIYNTSMDSQRLMQAVKEAVDVNMKDIFARRIQSAASVDVSYEDFWKRIEQVAMAGGKRFRPFLTAIGYGGIDEYILPVATAQELIHIAVLMHDDIIDQDLTRHGSENISGLYNDHYKKYLDDKRAMHYAHGAAILAGDALISESYHLIASSKLDESLKSKISQQLFN